MEFIHPALNTQVDAISGHYMITREERLPHPDGEVLYFIGYAVTERACCGPGGCGYAFVAGHVVSFRFRMTPDDKHISSIEPVQERWYADISKAIRRKEGVNQVHFLSKSGDYKVMF